MNSQRLSYAIFTAIFVLLLGVINGCIIKNEKVRPAFLDAYTDALKAKSVKVRTIGESASLNECTMTSTYTAHWGWDLAMYMKYAEIKVYRSPALIGLAVYDATWGGGRLINSSMPKTKYVS